MSEDNNYIYTDVKDDQKWMDLYGTCLVDRIFSIESFASAIYSNLYTMFTEKIKRVEVEYLPEGINLRYKVEDLPTFDLIERCLCRSISPYHYTEIAFVQGYQLYHHTNYSKMYPSPKNIQIGNKFYKICGRKFLFYSPTDVTFSNHHFTNFCKHNNLNVKEFTSRHDIINHFSTFEPFIIDNEKLYWLAPEQQNEEYKQVLRNEYILTYKL